MILTEAIRAIRFAQEIPGAVINEKAAVMHSPTMIEMTTRTCW